MTEKKSPYEILGVEKDADEQTLKEAYKALSKKYHPDAPTGSHDKFMELKNAYDLLMDPSKRNTFDIYGIHMDFYTESRNIAADLYCQMASSYNPGVPLEMVIRDNFDNQIIPSLTREKEQAEKKYKNLLSRFEKIIEKPEDDFLTPRVSEMITRLEQDYKQAWIRLDLHTEALRLLKLYKFDLTQIEEQVEKKRKNSTLPNDFLQMIQLNTGSTSFYG